MVDMARGLAAAGYRVVNIDYPSAQYRVEDLAGWLVTASFGTAVAAVALYAFHSRVTAFATWLFEPSGSRAK